jgi:hypothetical protein
MFFSPIIFFSNDLILQDKNFGETIWGRRWMLRFLFVQLALNSLAKLLKGKK